MPDYCPIIYISAESCDIAVLNALTNTQLATTITVESGTTLAENPFGDNHMVYDVAVNADNTRIYAGSGSHYPVSAPPFIDNTKNILQTLNSNLTGLAEWGPSLSALGILTDQDMAVSIDYDDNLLLLAWTAGPRLNLYRIDTTSQSVTQFWLGLNYDADGKTEFVIGSPKLPLIDMEIVNPSIIFYTTHGRNIFRFNFVTGQQLSVFKTIDPPWGSFGNSYGALRVCSKGLLITARYESYPYAGHPQFGQLWGEIQLLDAGGSHQVVKRFIRDLSLSIEDSEITNNAAFIPMCGLALGETDDIFYSDGVYLGGWLGISTFGCVVVRWRISTAEFLSVRKIETSFSDDPVTGMVSCQRFIRLRTAGVFGTVIGAT